MEVFFEAGVMILITLAFSIARRTNKSTFHYVIPLLAGLASGFAFIPPSAGSVLVSNMLGVDLGVMILVGVPTGILSLTLAGVIWGEFIGNKVNARVPRNIIDDDKNATLPGFKLVMGIIMIPLVLILLSTMTEYVTFLDPIKPVIQFFGVPFVALIIAILAGMFLLLKPQGYNMDAIKSIIDSSLKPTAGILLVITGGGIISEILQVCGMGGLVGSVLEESGLPIVLAAFLIAGLIRICVGAAVVSMTMTAGIIMTMPRNCGTITSASSMCSTCY